MRNPVVECSLSAFGPEHLVTTFTGLLLACGVPYGKDVENRSGQAVGCDMMKPKQGLSFGDVRCFHVQFQTVTEFQTLKIHREHVTNTRPQLLRGDEADIVSDMQGKTKQGYIMGLVVRGNQLGERCERHWDFTDQF